MQELQSTVNGLCTVIVFGSIILAVVSGFLGYNAGKAEVFQNYKTEKLPKK